MFRRDYNSMILKRIEVHFNRVLPFGSMVAWASAVAVYYSQIPQRFALYDAGIGFVLMLMSLFKKRLNIELKIGVTILIPVWIGMVSFMDGGFDSAAIQLIMISNVLAVLFLSRAKSTAVAFGSVGVFLWFYAYAYTHPVDIPVKSGMALWFIQFIVFVFYLFVLHTVVYSIRGYLLENIEELQDSMERTYELAYYDQLTHLPNQYHFSRLLSEKIEAGERGYVMIISAKNISVINSIYGEVIGDRVIVEIARVFSAEMLKDELLARVGGNEFGFFIESGDEQAFLMRVERYMTQFQNEFHISGMTKKIEFNIGYSAHEPQYTIDQTVHQAKMALTYAKGPVESNIIAYDKKLETSLKEDSFLRERLEDALYNSKFDVHYQAKVNTKTKEIVSFEALSRWYDTEIGMVSPTVFIPALEEMNRATHFGRIVIERVLAEHKSLCKKYGAHIRVSVNISPSHLIAPGFIEFVENAIEKSGVDPDRIIFEITEDVMIENFERAMAVFEKLRKIGIWISLDDFGSGYSSLNYLAKFDIDELKIDKSFVDQIEVNGKIDSMLEAIMQLALDYNINVVAEGVETPMQYAKLLEIGCDEIQGYYFSRPEPLE